MLKIKISKKNINYYSKLHIIVAFLMILNIMILIFLPKETIYYTIAICIIIFIYKIITKIDVLDKLLRNNTNTIRRFTKEIEVDVEGKTRIAIDL